jgi:hypothetical protein
MGRNGREGESSFSVENISDERGSKFGIDFLKAEVAKSVDNAEISQHEMSVSGSFEAYLHDIPDWAAQEVGLDYGYYKDEELEKLLPDFYDELKSVLVDLLRAKKYTPEFPVGPISWDTGYPLHLAQFSLKGIADYDIKINGEFYNKGKLCLFITWTTEETAFYI